jgi:hypothetical protein
MTVCALIISVTGLNSLLLLIVQGVVLLCGNGGCGAEPNQCVGCNPIRRKNGDFLVVSDWANCYARIALLADKGPNSSVSGP